MSLFQLKVKPIAVFAFVALCMSTVSVATAFEFKQPRRWVGATPCGPVQSSPVYNGMPFTYWPAVWNYQSVGWAADREVIPIVESAPAPRPMELLPGPGKVEPQSGRTNGSSRSAGSPYRILPVGK